MSRSEFRWNKKRKHYAYLFKDLGDMVANILLTTDCIFIDKKNGKRIIFKNIKLYRHPNPNKSKEEIYYIVNHRPYIDKLSSFSENVYKHWSWHKNDKRKIKRLKKYNKHKDYFRQNKNR